MLNPQQGAPARAVPPAPYPSQGFAMIVVIILLVIAAIVVAGIMKAQRRMAYADGLRAARGVARDPDKPSWTGDIAKADMFRSFVRAKARSHEVSENFISLAFNDDELSSDMLRYAAEVERRGGDLTAQINECSKLLLASWEKIPLADRARFG